MTTFRRIFGLGRMQQDVDNRNLQQGEYREAFNSVVRSSEGSSEGCVQKIKGNKRLTNLSFGANPITIGEYSYERRNRIYWLVKSDTGCYLCEWDHDSQSASFILQDTRDVSERVFNLSENSLCTGINIVPAEDEDKEQMLISVDNLEPIRINISRARTYGENGFEAEDIFTIKKWPKNSPTTALLNTGNPENNLEERYLTFCYRFKYLDGEFSAFSTFSNYRFVPGKFDLDYETFENLGMVNAYNAIRIGFNTGESQVTDIQLAYKNSNSNTIYVIDTFNKEEYGWGDDETQYHLFTNNKTYTSIAERELYRTFDNVPRMAKAQTLIGNKVFYGNYTEGYDIADASGNPIAIDFTISLKTTSLEGITLPKTISDGDSDDTVLTFDLTDISLDAGTRISFDLSLNETTYSDGSYEWTTDFILNNSFENAAALAQDEDFIIFITQGLSNNFSINYTATPPDNSSTPVLSEFTIVSYDDNTITISAPTITYTIDDTPENTEDDVTHDEISYWAFEDNSNVVFYNNESGATIKTNRSVESGLLYEDKWGRKSTVLTSPKNTLFVPQAYSASKNSLLMYINHIPPAWADRCRVVVKSEPLTYYTIYATIFFEDGVYRWVKLDGDNVDKVQRGDILIVKKDLSGPISNVIKLKVLEIDYKDENFISDNNNDDGAEIVEPAGTYMKIKPNGIFMDYNENEFIVDDGDASSVSGSPVARVDQLYVDNGDGTYTDVAITQGSIITLWFKSFGRDQGPYIFEQTYTVQSNYDNFQDWFEANITLPLEVPDYDDVEYSDIQFVRGTPYGDNGINVTGNSDDPLFMTVKGIIPGNGSSGSGHHGFIATTVTIRLVDSLVIFETEQEQSDIDIYYETDQTFDIVDGKHTGNIQNQTDTDPAIIESSFFNCFAMGNGAESYRVKDSVNKRFLRPDLKPTTTDPNGYRAVKRSCDITYSEAFNASSNINGLNVFNLSTANYKDDLEKAHGSIQKLFARENDIIVLQEEKAGKVLFDKDAIYTAGGNEALISMPGILGQYIPYMGSYGIGKQPESFSVDRMGRIKYASVKNGTFVRLSMDGIEPLSYGLKNRFRNIFISQPNAKIISGYDPYFDLTNFVIGHEPERIVQFGCGTSLIKDQQEEPFTYELKLNDLGGDVVINYNVTSGNVTISAEFNESTYVVSNVTGVGNLTFERDSLVENIVTITITPIGGAASYTLQNSCPVGTELKIVCVVLNDSEDSGQTMTDRFKWGTSSFVSTDELFTDGPLTRFQTLSGIEGQGLFPSNGALVTIQAFKDGSNNGHFSTAECNKLGYLVSSTVYTDSQYNDILENADTEFVTVSQTGEEGFAITNSGSFVFNRASTDEILYLIWDYTSRNPVLSNDTANVNVGQDVIIDVLANDEVSESATVSIATEPNYGNAIVNVDNTITYTHDGSNNFDDSFTYTVTENGCSSTATVNVIIGVSCGDSVEASGTQGIYEIQINFGTGIGYVGVEVDAVNIPDRFQLMDGDTVLADSKFIGDTISSAPTPGDYTLDVYEYDGSAFVDTGADETITITSDDIADGSSEYPTDGNRILYFVKSTATPTTYTLRVTGTNSSTSWSLVNVICPQETIPTLE